jgi:hypothetical protein
MIPESDIAAIIEQYVSHGWKLRRVLSAREIGLASPLFGDAEIRIGEREGLWFSRRSQPDREAWELRRISPSPFAIVEVIPDGLTDQERDVVLEEAENRMFDAERPSETSH